MVDQAGRSDFERREIAARYGENADAEVAVLGYPADECVDFRIIDIVSNQRRGVADISGFDRAVEAVEQDSLERPEQRDQEQRESQEICK